MTQKTAIERFTLAASLLASMAIVSATAHAASPKDLDLPDGKETVVECDWKGGKVRGIETSAGTFHYKVYIPEDYSKNPKRKYPCLFISDAGGKATLGGMENYVKKNRWLAVMLVESCNATNEPIDANFLAAHDDAVNRLHIQEGLKVATGQSGGGFASSIDVGLRPGFGGLITHCAGARWHLIDAQGVEPDRATAPRFTYSFQGMVCLLHGDKDENVTCVAYGRKGYRNFDSFVFIGGHVWATPAAFEDAMFSFEQFAYVQGNVQGLPPEAYADYFDVKFDQIEDMKDPLAKYRTLTFLKAVAQKQGLAGKPQFKTKVKQVEDQIAKLEKDADFTKTKAAYEDWLKIKPLVNQLAAGNCARDACAAGNGPKPGYMPLDGRKGRERMIPILEAFIAMHPGTDLAKAAQERVDRAKNGMPATAPAKK